MKPYRRTWPPPAPRPLALLLVGAVLLLVVVATWVAPARSSEPSPTFQGRSAKWWAHRAVQARKDANARAATIRRLRRTLAHDPSIQEAIRLAAIVYPAFSEQRGWQIAGHESLMTPDPVHAVNRSSGASGLLQFMPSTFRATPFGSLSIWSPYAQAMAAGWLHQRGQGCVHWQIRC